MNRESVDFDFFSSEPLNKDALRSNLAFLKDSRLIQDSENALGGITPTDVKFSFFGALSFGRFGDTELAVPFDVVVASLDDLLALKLKVIHQRAELKDYRGIAAILASGKPLERGMAIACAMFKDSFSPTITAKALTYFEDGDLAELSGEEKEILIRAATAMGDLPTVSMQSPLLAEPVSLPMSGGMHEFHAKESKGPPSGES